MASSTLHVRIVSPKEVMLDTNAISVSSRNSRGNFDILPRHANFITLIENSPIEIRIDKKKRLTFAFPLAIILTTENNINIYTYSQYPIPSSKKSNT